MSEGYRLSPYMRGSERTETLKDVRLGELEYRFNGHEVPVNRMDGYANGNGLHPKNETDLFLLARSLPLRIRGADGRPVKLDEMPDLRTIRLVDGVLHTTSDTASYLGKEHGLGRKKVGIATVRDWKSIDESLYIAEGDGPIREILVLHTEPRFDQRLVNEGLQQGNRPYRDDPFDNSHVWEGIIEAATKNL